MKILIYTGYNNNPRYKEMGDFSSMNKLGYAQKHGYSFLCDRGYENYNRNISWFKIRRILEIMDDVNNNFDYIFWTDADSFIVNPEIKLEDIINSDGKRSTIVRVDEINNNIDLDPSNNGLILSDDELGPCMANFFVNCKNDNVSDFLYQIYYEHPNFENHPWWDQGAAHYLWKHYPKMRDFLKVLPKEKLHRAFFDYQPGDFIIHDKFRVKDGKIIPKLE